MSNALNNNTIISRTILH